MLEQEPGERLPQAQHTVGVSAGEHTASATGPNEERDWIDTQFSRLDRLLCTAVDPVALARLLLFELAPLLGAARAAVYTLAQSGAAGAESSRSPGRTDSSYGSEGPRLFLAASYAGVGSPESLALGEGLVGQCALERRKLIIRDVPEGHFNVHSALGSSTPRELAFVPVWLNASCLGVFELALFVGLSPARESLLERLCARCPAPTAAPPTAPSPAAAEVLSRPSQRAGFWGKLSHELRSPLNSVLVLSKLLSENGERNLTAKQVTFAKAIHASGNDLLGLVNAISDLSKIETNRLVLEPTEMSFAHLRAHIERAFEPVARARRLEFSVELAPDLPEVIVTDSKRLRQIMKCLLSNAFKFTESGRVGVSVSRSKEGWSRDRERLERAPGVVAFAVKDTGVGMSEGEQRSILDVFPPDRIEARRGTGASGLGLAISRELARLLGGELRVESVVGCGSTFTLFLPTSGFELTAAPSHPAAAERAGWIELEPELGSTLDESAAVESVSQAAPSRDIESPDMAAHDNPSDGPNSRPRQEVEPASQRGARSRKRREAEASPSELSGLSIMLVDDDVRSAFTLTGVLERQGVAVSHAEDVGEALERLAEGRRASALLIDAELLASGSEDSRSRLLQHAQRLPIVALTRRTRPAPALPAHIHQLPKPVDPRQLVSVLRSLAAQAKSPSSGPIQSEHRDQIP